MGRIVVVLALSLLPLSVVPSPGQKEKQHSTDVMVYGGTASGVIAAVAVAREDRSVILVEPGQHLGGMVSGGLGATDVGNKAAIGGYSREFFDRVREFYKKKYGPDSAQVKDANDGFRFEPHVAEKIFKEMIAEAKVPVLFGKRLDRVEKQETVIQSITLEGGERVFAKVFIDASYEGDLMAKAKVSYTVGREGRDQYKESLAGVQKYSPAHQWPVKVSPFDAKKNLLPFIQKAVLEAPGTGDRKVQAYNFRMCMTKVPEQMVPFLKPPDYDAKRYELLARYLAKRPDVKVGQLMNPVKVPNGKTDTNNNGPFSTDHIGANWDYPDADYATRDKIRQDHVEYQQGFMYFLANDPRVPAELQKDMRSWGLAKDEFTDTGHWPHQFYVREARRMLGEYFMTQADIMDNRLKDDSIGLGSYNTDSHHVQRVVGPDGFVLNEGDFQVGVKPYAIPYRSLLPKASECTNLLVTVCMSASHVAYGTIRMEPVYMIMGQASGVAAAVALEGKTPVHNIPILRLRQKLAAQKAVLSPEGITKPGAGPAVSLDPAKLAGVVVDDHDAIKTGHWLGSTSIGPFVGDGYLHDNNENQGKMKVRFTPKLPQAGKYEVRLFYTANPNRASNALVVIQSSQGETKVRVDQKKAAKDGFRLGVFMFPKGDKSYVEIRNDGADGHVIADAVQWLIQK